MIVCSMRRWGVAVWRCAGFGRSAVVGCGAGSSGARYRFLWGIRGKARRFLEGIGGGVGGIGGAEADEGAGGLAGGLGLVAGLGDPEEGAGGEVEADAGERGGAGLVSGGVLLEERFELVALDKFEEIGDRQAEGEGDVGDGEGRVQVEREEALAGDGGVGVHAWRMTRRGAEARGIRRMTANARAPAVDACGKVQGTGTGGRAGSGMGRGS